MKSKSKVLLALLAVMIIAAGAFAAIFLNSPEYMFLNLYSDIQKNGIDAAEEYLSENGAKKLEYIIKLYDSGLIDLLKPFFGGGADVDGLLSKLSEADWKLEKVTRKKNQGSAILEASITDKPYLSVELYLVRTDGKWKIDGFGNVTPLSGK